MSKDIRDVKLALARNGFCLHSKGNFNKYSFYHKRLIQPIYTYLAHMYGSDSLDNIQLKKMRLQLHLDKNELDDFLDGNMSKKIYIELLKKKGILAEDK